MSEHSPEGLLMNDSKGFERTRLKNFFEVAGISHAENAWSDIYAYFFDPHNPHKLGTTFFYSLITLINEKAKPGIFNLPTSVRCINVYREVDTCPEDKNTKKGRIDLLLYADDTAIVIENKVFHSLSNNLNDYMDFVGSYKDKRIGVILTLKPIYVSNEKYINVTHLELLEKVWKEVANRPCDEFCRIILEQFYTTVKSMSGLNSDNQKRFLENKTVLLENARLVQDVKNWYHGVFYDRELITAIKEKLKAFPRVNPELIESQSKKYRYIQFRVNEIIKLNILFEPLWNSDYDIHYFPKGRQSLFITLEIPKYADLKRTCPNIDKEIKDIVEPCGIYVKPQSLHWWHFACKEIPVSDNELFDNQMLADKILNELQPGQSHEIFDLLKDNSLYQI